MDLLIVLFALIAPWLLLYLGGDHGREQVRSRGPVTRDGAAGADLRPDEPVWPRLRDYPYGPPQT